MKHRIFDLGTLDARPAELTVRAIDAAASFPWESLLPELLAEVGRDAIPVEWADLSRFGVGLEAAAAPHEHHHDHDGDHGHHDHGEAVTLLHGHVEEDGDTAHILGAEVDGRSGVLGLAWYSGRISMERTLIDRPDLAIEVFLAEAAHMVDFFFMTPEHRLVIFMAFHPGMTVEEALSHGHDWFDDDGPGDPNVVSTDYWAWVGESLMAGFVFAYAPHIAMPMFARQPWVHRASPAVGAMIREILTPAPPRAPEWVGVDGLRTYHRVTCPSMSWSRRERVLTFDELAQRRPCRLCKPA